MKLFICFNFASRHFIAATWLHVYFYRFLISIRLLEHHCDREVGATFYALSWVSSIWKEDLNFFFPLNDQVQTLTQLWKTKTLIHSFPLHKRNYNQQRYAEIWGGVGRNFPMMKVFVFFLSSEKYRCAADTPAAHTFNFYCICIPKYILSEAL